MKNKSQTIIKIIIHILVLFLPILFEKVIFMDEPFCVDRCVLIAIILQFIALNFTVNRKKLWDFIYFKRYAMIIIIFLYLVINGYHGSSIGIYSYLIQPNNSVENSTPFIGKSQLIRSDEYAVNTMGILNNVVYNDMNVMNNHFMAKDLNMEIYPQSPVKSISLLTKPQNIGYVFLPVSNGFSFSWYFLFFVCFMAVFEFFMIVTNHKRLHSLLGAILICFSTSLLWWNSFTFLTYGILAFHFFRLILVSKEWQKKLLFSILLGWAGSCYILILYPAWQLTYGFMFLALFIWQIVENKKKIKWTDILYILPCLATIGILVLPQVLGSLEQVLSIMGTEYPGARHEIGGDDWKLNFMYLPSIFYAFVAIDNPCELSQTFSLYPLPIIVSLALLFLNRKKNKKDSYLILLIIVAIFLSIFNYFKVPFLSKVTFMYMVQGKRITNVVGVICVMLMIRTLSIYEENNITTKKMFTSSFVSIIITVICAYFSYQYLQEKSTIEYYTISKVLCSVLIFYLMSFMYLLNYKKYNKIYMPIFMIFTIICGMLIFPMSKGLSVVYEKPVSKAINNIVKENKDAKWLSVDTEYQIANYLLANGARVYNSVNYSKNDEFWNVVDPSGENNYYYNRYAHITISITDTPTSYELISSDLLKIDLESSQICSLDVDYILSGKDLIEKSYDKLKLKEEYNEDGLYIYKTLCN